MHREAVESVKRKMQPAIQDTVNSVSARLDEMKKREVTQVRCPITNFSTHYHSERCLRLWILGILQPAGDATVV